MPQPPRSLGDYEIPNLQNISLWRVIRPFLILLLIVSAAIFCMQGMIIVPDGKMAILIKKTGKNWTERMGDHALLNVPILAPNEDSKGIQANALGEGWHFLNPYSWDYEIHPQTSIPEGSMGVLTKLSGTPLPGKSFQVIADKGQMGIVREVLKPGNYLINPYEFALEVFPAIKVPDGHRGVVTLLAGKIPVNPNVFLVNDGERGVLAQTLSPGMYYENPYEKLIIPVDIRSHRVNLSEQENVTFPSFDGFSITMEGNLEWRVDPKRVSEVYVRFKDNRDIILGIVEKILMPNARAIVRIEGSKHQAKDFISGDTREKLQSQFYGGLKAICEKEGVLIEAARITNCIPPDEICNPIQAREIAIREREKYQQESEREKEQIILQQEEARKDFEVRKTKAETEVSVAIMNANREKEVALIFQKQNLEVAKKRLEAAKNEAAAIIAQAQAEADVVRMQNKAEASALQDAQTAFGSGKNYANFLMLEKIARSLDYILANTDSPFIEMFRQVQANIQKAKEENK